MAIRKLLKKKIKKVSLKKKTISKAKKTIRKTIKAKKAASKKTKKVLRPKTKKVTKTKKAVRKVTKKTKPKTRAKKKERRISVKIIRPKETKIAAIPAPIIPAATISSDISKEKSFIKRCPECKSINLSIDSKRGEVICKNCGLVLDENLVDIGQEWREFSGEEMGKRRAGAPLTMTKHDMGTGTQIGTSAEIYSLPSSQRRKMMRLKQWHDRTSTSLERNLKYALVELKRIASILNIPVAIEEEAARIYNLAVRKGLVRGRSMESVVVGAIYIASRQFNLPRSLNEICKLTGINKREVGKTYRFVARELGIKLLPSGPADYIPKFANKLGFSASTQTKALEIIKKSKEVELTSGRGPTGLAAAALYVASLMTGEKRTQREIADVVGVTEVTIRNRYKEIIDRLELKDELEKLKKERE